MAGRVLHISGPYEGMEIDMIAEMDPAYILDIAYTTKGHGISQDAINRARQLIDTYTDEEYIDHNEVLDLTGFQMLDEGE